MSGIPPSVCEGCGKEGLVYGFEGRYYCPSCLSKKKPPLPYRGPERRRRPNTTAMGFTRRTSDRKGPSKKP